MKVNEKMITSTGQEGGVNASLLEDAEKSIDGTLASNSDLKIPTEKALVTYSANGWIPSHEEWEYSSKDSPTFYASVEGDKRSKYSKGMKLKLEQEQALTGYWTFDSDASSQVGSFTPTNIGTPTYTAGKFGNALTLDGSTDAISLADNALLKPTGDFTIGCWVKTGATGAIKIIFSSYSAITYISGIQFRISSTNTVQVIIADNTSATAVSSLTGTTVITDGNWHYSVFTFKSNWGQLYLDGKLEVSGYKVTPVYAGTTYIRIGSRNPIGGSDDSFFNGQIDDLFLINGYALDEETIRAKYEADTAQGTGNITVTKKFLLTDISYSSPNTTLTMYGGTDFALSSGAISNPYYSMVEQPFGFNRNPNKWSVQIISNTNYVVSSPVAGTIYNPGNLQISVPIGKWKIRKANPVQAVASGSMDFFIAISYSPSINTNAFIISSHYISQNHELSIFGEMEVEMCTKKIIYITIVTTTSGTTSLIFKGSASPIILKATSVYI